MKYNAGDHELKPNVFHMDVVLSGGYRSLRLD